MCSVHSVRDRSVYRHEPTNVTSSARRETDGINRANVFILAKGVEFAEFTTQADKKEKAL